MEKQIIMRYTNEERLSFARSHKKHWPGNLIDGSVTIHPTAVIGDDGFGYVRQEDQSLLAMPHAGGITIEKNVIIRAFVTIDRGVIRNTFIGEGSKLDHHVHCAHNVWIGKHNTLANGCIIEGSCEIGNYNTFGTGVIVQTKVKIGSNCIFGSGSVVTKDVEDNSVMVGNPARLLRKNDI
jgi:UDP-3-O-[3-hydroxymyristoyl] glucosamine N-acyltransferase